MAQQVTFERPSRDFTPKPHTERKATSLFISAGFLLLLLLPSLDQLLNLSAGFKSTEKRILTPLPTLKFPHLRTYIADFNQYYKENFGWRNALFYQYSRFKYSVMGVSPLPDKVVLSKNGWFYPGNSMNHILDQHRGLSPIPPDTLHAIARHLTRLQHQIAAAGARLYLLVAPDSYSIYPENLPDHLLKSPHVSNFEKFKRYMGQHTTIPVIDVRRSLRTAKASHILYYKTDTHWNEYGALIASLTLVNSIRHDFPLLPVARVSDFTVHSVAGDGGDLVTMLAMNREIIDSIVYKVKPVRSLLAQNTQTIDNLKNGLPSQRFVTASSQLPKLLLIGDSFSFSLNQSLPSYFRESYLVRDHKCRMELVRREHPDIVVFEIVERNLSSFGQL